MVDYRVEQYILIAIRVTLAIHGFGDQVSGHFSHITIVENHRVFTSVEDRIVIGTPLGVASLHDEEMALALALSEAAMAQTYLALLPNSDVFIVLHGLHRWVTTPPSRSVNEGKLVAFEGETLGEKGEEPPDLLQFEGNEADLFGLLSLAQTDLALVANFYDNPGPRDTKWFGEAVLDKAHGVRLGRLIPIPTVWAAMFLDYPNIGTALRRTRALIGSVSLEKVENFKLLAYSMT